MLVSLLHDGRVSISARCDHGRIGVGHPALSSRLWGLPLLCAVQVLSFMLPRLQHGCLEVDALGLMRSAMLCSVLSGAVPSTGFSLLGGVSRKARESA